MKKIRLITPIFVFFYTCQSFAQVDIHNNGIVYLSSPTDTFFVGGALTNASGAEFTNNGVVQIKKDLTNNQASMSVGTGTLMLNGTAAQSVAGSQVFKTYHFISDNGLGITLNNNLSVSGLHTYISGIITTSSTPNYMIYEAGSSYTGDADSRHVNGWIKKIGSTDFIFPVGDNNYERTVALTNLTTSSEFDVKRNPRVTPNFIQLLSPLVLVDTSEYWTINKISGGSAKVAMNWDVSKVPFPSVLLSDVRAASYDAGISYWTNIGGSATGNTATSGSVTSGSIAAFNRNFTMGSISFTLPLKIIDFNGVRMHDYTHIAWTVMNELNVRNYELLKSDDGSRFYPVTMQLPLNNGGLTYYQYDDRSLLNGTAWYRIHATENSGREAWSEIIKINTSANTHSFYVMNNPVAGMIAVYASQAYKGVYQYSLISNSGQLMQSGNLDINKEGVQYLRLSNQFSPGIYSLILQSADHRLAVNIYKQ